MASACIAKMVSKVCSYVEDQHEYQRDDAKDKLTRLNNNLWKIPAVLHKASSLQTKDSSMESWLGNIKDAAYQAEDVLDLFDYRFLEAKAEDMEKLMANTFDYATAVKRSVRVLKRFLFSDEDLNKLIANVDKFDKIASEMQTFLELTNTRDRKPGKALQCKSYSVIAIVGVAGVGKTALLQRVYSHFRDTGHFDIMAWLYVSEKFGIKRLTKEMVTEMIAWHASIPDDLNSISNLDLAQRILQDKLNGSRILVVLDDVWNEMSSKWETLYKPLQFAKMIHLNGLEGKEYLGHFMQCAFGNATPSGFPTLVKIGKQLAKKLAGSPLAAKTGGADDIMPALKLSYEHLPNHLKRCFVYFALFPKNHQLQGDVLIQMWQAHAIWL
uniref:NB-ARC domain-containing protein n=1 Tax=Setaria italica TaxID=4555 RepID=K3YC11_SETIT